MKGKVTTRTERAKDAVGEVYTLTLGDAVVEVWPFMGFNALRWSVGGVPVFYTSPEWQSNPVPTRSGHPILFPFPNRMKAGKFTFKGHDYQLPLNDSSGPNAIHGFTPRRAWRVVAQDDSPSIKGEFQLSKDASDAVWPADARIKITYTLQANALRVDTVIDAADGNAMPFGLGFHPYFVMAGAPLNDWTLAANASTLWRAEGNLPTGEQVTVPAALDFRASRLIGDTVLDTLYGDVSLREGGEVARLSGPSAELLVNIDSAFGELLLFTPPHRQAVAIEPYTCATDAANLESRGVKAGWRVLAPGEVFTSWVEYHWHKRA
jgi:aldose 1-epimerase